MYGARTERHLGEEVMHDVEVRRVVQEELAHPTKEISVNCRGGPAHERPAPIAVVGYLRIRVL